ncbi:MAG TPA: malto-oligosyltrehalose synthase [Thermomicrobiales bacterium]|nr:malto-oligosyltrehalose synthase [Thermomicrobiales bacterium]
MPRATYRMQLHAGFGFVAATRQISYLRDLGISHLYTSPIAMAVPGSMHGYDVIDQNRLNPEIGTRAEFDAMVAALHAAGMGLIIDIVPNHMGIAEGRNPWWQDVLENGRFSPQVETFDIDWQPLKPELRNKVLLPVLGDQYGVVLERGELHLVEQDGAFTVWYYNTPLPIAPPSYPVLLREVLQIAEAELAADDIVLLELQSLIGTFERLPTGRPVSEEAVTERLREQTIGKMWLQRLLAESSVVRAAVDTVVLRCNGTVGERASFDLLDTLLSEQSYRLAFWRVAAEEINYRRFFAINDLAAIRPEVPAVFAETHAMFLELITAGAVDGLRIDHTDGLWDPAGYFRNLQRAAFVARCRRLWTDPETWPQAQEAIALWWDQQSDRPEIRGVTMVVEKILTVGEQLPADWMIDGTVGYDFLNEANELLIDAGQVAPFTRLAAGFTGEDRSFSVLGRAARHMIMRVALTSEVNVLVNVLNAVSEHDRRTRDFTLNDLRNAVRSVIACFPIYRTYLGPEDAEVGPEDARAIERAVRDAIRFNPEQDQSIFEFILQVLIEAVAPEEDSPQAADKRRFRYKMQQLTGPVMAKGLEDTAFYEFNRLIALNEVGGEPDRFGRSVPDIHAAFRRRASDWPHTMLAGSTHDTKRSEDARARIAVLSEFPRDWRAAINRWSRLNRKHRRRVEGFAAPHKADEYVLYQTLIGVAPDDGLHPAPEYVERIVQAMQKSVREAAVRSNWTNPHEGYEAALEHYIRTVLDPAVSSEFLADLALMEERVARAGWINSLTTTILRFTTPGFPDLYQGTEIRDESLVDPDNRRPVDYGMRHKMLTSLRRRAKRTTIVAEAVAGGEQGLAKLYAIDQILATRAKYPEIFAQGDYLALTGHGPQAEHCLAFQRRSANTEMIVIVPRLVDTLTRNGPHVPLGEAIWHDTVVVLPTEAVGTWRDVLSGQNLDVGREATLRIGEALRTLPAAVLIREGHEQ